MLKLADIQITVVVPVYDEVATVETALRRIRSLESSGARIEIVAVDDGSEDGSSEVLDRLEMLAVVDQVIRFRTNRGKGAAVRAAVMAAQGDIVAIQDADLEYDPADLMTLLQPILTDEADAVYGSRFGDDRTVGRSLHRAINGSLTSLSNWLTGLNLTDMETCMKVVRRDLFQSLPLTSDRFGIEPEITAFLAQAGARIVEIPVGYNGRSRKEGKKITWRDGVAAFWHILRFNARGRRLNRIELPSLANVVSQTTK